MGDPAAQRQPKAKALVAAGAVALEKGLHNFILYFLRNAAAVVGYGQRPALQDDPEVRRPRLAGIVIEVGDKHGQQIGVPQDGVAAQLNLQRNALLLCGRQEEGEQLPLQRLRAQRGKPYLGVRYRKQLGKLGIQPL